MARAVLFCCVLLLTTSPAAAADPLAHPTKMIERAHLLAWDAKNEDSVPKFRLARAKYQKAAALLRAINTKLDAAQQDDRIKQLEEAASGIAMCREHLRVAGALEPEVEEPASPVAPLPPRKKGQLAKNWVRAAIAKYHEADDPLARAAYAHRILNEVGVHALPALCTLFESEEDRQAREGIHTALADFGTSRVANLMKGYATRKHEGHWQNALDVIYRCLRKPDKTEKERPFQRAVRAFHVLKDSSLSSGMIKVLDEMGREGVAALGEVLFVTDVGHHNKVISILSTKNDGRAVPALVHKMNRFKFDQDSQVPAHEALLKLEWYAVPELINRLDDKASGIWISWSLRKITGETMGTDKRKWHDWWKTAKKDHPEVLKPTDADEPKETTGK